MKTSGRLFEKAISDKRLLSKMYKELLKSNGTEAKSSVKNGAEDLNRHLIKEDTHMANKHEKRC